MTLDYTGGCVNLRDVGEFVNLIADDELLPVGRILRGGKIDFVKDLQSIGAVRTILNLRNGPDPEHFDVRYLHFPISNDYEKYNTSQKEVRLWLNRVMKTFEQPDLHYPVLVHCTSGKDRTGVVVAALLSILGISRNIIIEEYLFSEGEVTVDLIELALDGLSDTDRYFDRVDLLAVRKNVLAGFRSGAR